jgi:hypothetical protein
MTAKGSTLAAQMRKIREAALPGRPLHPLIELEYAVAAERHATVIQVYVFDWIDKLGRMIEPPAGGPRDETNPLGYDK